jgi:predicted DNA-binding protein
MHRGYVGRMRHDKHDKSTCSAQLVLRLPPELRDKIESAAAREDRTLGYVLRRLIDQWRPDHEAAA